jgi:hypothetical protein
MRRLILITLLPLLTSSFVSLFAQATHPQNDVHWCASIPAPRALQEAKFTAVYVFELSKSGKPIEIKKAVNHFLKDDEPFIRCISSWSLPTASGKGTASFVWEWGWTNLEVSAGEFRESVPYDPHSLAPQPHPNQQ